MRHHQLEGTGNKFTAIPEAGSGFNGKHINSEGEQKNYPAGDGVDFFEVKHF